MLVNGSATLSNFNSTNSNIVGNKVFFGFFKTAEGLKLDLLVCSLISEHLEFLKYLHLLATLRSVADIEHFRKSKSTCAPDYVA